MSSIHTTCTAKQAEPDYRSVPIDEITVKDRRRKDRGDIDGLAESIKRLGLLQPVVLDTYLNLIAGERRILAAQKLGWDRIDAHVVHNLDDAVACLEAERDENTCRKEMTTVELAALADSLMELEKEAAKQRQRHHGGTAPGRRVNTEETVSQVSSGKAKDRVAAAVGVSAPTLDKLQTVAKQAIPELVELVDKGEVKIAPAAEVASLPAEEQQAIVKAGPAAVKQAAKHRKQAKAKAPAQARVGTKAAPPKLSKSDKALILQYQLTQLIACVRDLGDSAVIDGQNPECRRLADELIGEIGKLFPRKAEPPLPNMTGMKPDDAAHEIVKRHSKSFIEQLDHWLLAYADIPHRAGQKRAGIRYAFAATNVLKRCPHDDEARGEMYEIVANYCRTNAPTEPEQESGEAA